MTFRQAQGHPERSRGMTIDQELQQALDVDPSPEFLARVRTRIASEPVPRQWGLSWMFAAAAAATVIVVAVVVMRSTGANKTGSEVLASRSLGAIVIPVESRPEGLRYERNVGDAAVVAQPFRAAPDVIRKPADEIVIDPREAAALRRLLGIGNLRAEEGFVLTKADEIEIEPLVIAPLEASGEGVRQ
jgi:hypothetical protein